MTALGRNIPLLFVMLSSATLVYGQQLDNIDSLKKKLQHQKNDTNKVKLLYNLGFSYVAGSYADTALFYAQHAMDLAENLDDENGIFWSGVALCESLAILGNYPLALEYSFKTLALAQKSRDTLKLCFANGNLASCYYYMRDYENSIKYARIVMDIIANADIYWPWIQMTKSFHAAGQPDSSLLYANKAYEMIRDDGSLYKRSLIAPLLGNAYASNGKYDSALLYYRMGVPFAISINTPTHLVDDYYGIAEVYKSKGELDSALWFGKKIVAEEITKTYPAGLLNAANLLTEIYESKNNSDSALKYLKLAVALKDSLTNQQKTIAVQNLIYKEQEKQKEIQLVRSKFRDRLVVYALLGGLVLFIVVAGIFLKSHRQKQLQRIRNSIADDLHDDLGSTLSSISIMSELAKAKSPQASSLLASIEESSVYMQESMSDIVWAIKTDNDSLDNALQRMNQFASEILDSKNIAFDFTSSVVDPAVRLTMKQRKNFSLFFKEAINNAAKHSDATAVSVLISQAKGYVEMIIKDNGKGFDVGKVYRGNGMHSLKKRADELNGNFDIQSGFNEGTMLKLRFKIT